MHKHAEYPEVVLTEAYNNYCFDYWKNGGVGAPSYEQWEKDNAAFIKQVHATARQIAAKSAYRSANVIQARPKKERVARVKREGPSKKEQAMQIYRDLILKGHGRKIFVHRCIDVLGMTKAGAMTYFYMCKRETE